MQLLTVAEAGTKGSAAKVGGAVNAGIQCDSARNVAALRFQLASWPKSTVGWEWPNFLTQGSADLTADDEWAMVVDFRVLEPALRKGMQEGMDKPNLRLNDGPYVNWHAGKGLHLYVAGEAIDACKQFVEDTDVDFDAKIDLSFAVKPDGVLTMAGKLDAGPTDPLEVIGCIFTAATLFPFLGLEMLGDGKITFWEYAGGVLGTGLPLAVFAILSMDEKVMDKAKVPSQLGTMACQQDQDNVSTWAPAHNEDEMLALLEQSPADRARLEQAVVDRAPLGPVLRGHRHAGQGVAGQRHPPRPLLHAHRRPPVLRAPCPGRRSGHPARDPRRSRRVRRWCWPS